MDYKDLKRGDVVIMSHNENEYIDRIIIIDRVEQSITGEYKLYTYAELEDDDLFLERDEPGYSYDIKYYSFRTVTSAEKEKMYNKIGKYFTEEYDKDWYNHFTDSSYFDVQDYLLDIFCIKTEEYDNDMLYPDFVDDIHTYIWKKLCDAMGCKIYDGDEFVEQLVNKQEFIAKLKNYLSVIDFDMQYWNAEDGFLSNKFIDELIKYMEE